MARLPLYSLLERAPGGFRLKILALALLAVAAPSGILIALAVLPAPLPRPLLAGALGVSMIGAIGFIGLLAQMLRPLALSAKALSAWANEGRAPGLPSGHTDEAGRMMADIDAIYARYEAMDRRLSHRHPVTALATRERFIWALDRDMQRSRRNIVLAVVRLADYDTIAARDPAAADAVLAAFAKALMASVEASRPVGHAGRDAFAIWMRGVDSPQSVAAELQALATALDLAPLPGVVVPSVQMGAAIFPLDAEDGAGLMNKALAALEAPGQAPGKVAFVSALSHAAARERAQLERNLRDAIDRDEFRLHYQPVIDLAAGGVVGAEALLRWQHPDLGLAPPGQFIPALEQSGLIDEVGPWVLESACREAKTWQSLGLGSMSLGVNLSPRQFADPRLANLVALALDRSGLEPAQLELEVSESTVVADVDAAARVFEMLRELGVGVAVDDFGAGAASLSRLQSLPFTTLKIDRKLVTGIQGRREAQAVCGALVELARGLGVKALAEGVETREEMDALRRLGCTRFQGFFFARPLAAPKFVRKITDADWLALLAPTERFGLKAVS